MDADTMIARAQVLADDVLFPAALTVDQADWIPESTIQSLVEQGFYGIAAPAETGGLGEPDMAVAVRILETLASGCLATAFTWMQHHGPVLTAAYCEQPGIREKWLAPLASGELRGGIALAGARQGGLAVRRTGDGYLLNGSVPWVTGWDMIDLVHVAALDDSGNVVFLLMDAVASESLGPELNDLVAARASRTVTLTFRDHLVPVDRFTGAQPFADWQRAEASGSALNGALALGVATRCHRLLGDDAAGNGFADEIDACRAALIAADAGSTPAARAVASELALRAATTLMVQTGSRSVLTGNPAQMLLREAGFLLVFGTRPLIRDALLARISR
ncbi:acyl-CoA dehydrogenase family protein [Kribbella sp. CA-294648]|uniref:acyl-CoA dehydrogenase family protein n=1 Tax=Kribbella sp. CA-294648 TaxID=3239948 RepID=UPI003D90683C